MKTIIYLSLAALLCTACGCTKDNLPIEKLPPITQTGANTFGCLYNGKVFIPVKPDKEFMQPSPGDPIEIYGYYIDTENESDLVYATRGKNITTIQYIHLYIYRLRIKGVGLYSIQEAVYDTYNTQPFHSYISCRAISPKTGKYKFYGSYANSGEINITRCDNNNWIYSGTFKGLLKEVDGDEIIQITEGRFDLNLKTLRGKN